MSLRWLKLVTWSPALRLAMITLRGYVDINALLLLINATESGDG